MTVTATYRDDNLTVVFSGDDEYGDDPMLGSITGIRVVSAELCGVELYLKPGLAAALIVDLADGLEWRNE